MNVFLQDEIKSIENNAENCTIPINHLNVSIMSFTRYMFSKINLIEKTYFNVKNEDVY